MAGRQWSGDDIRRHTVDPRQFIDFRVATLPNGARIIDAYNGSGLTFTVLPDRGLDMWAAHYNGIPLTWISQGSPHVPDFGLTWLQQFSGGLLATCGLSHVGAPETDAETGEFRDFHGRYHRLRTQDVSITREGTDSVSLAATVSENTLYGEQLELARRYTLRLGEPVIRWADVVTNRGDQPVPLMLLYHINVGFPLVSAGARLVTPHERVYARDEDSRQGFDVWADYDAATPGYPAQVFLHHVRQDPTGESEAVLVNGDLGLSIRWNASTMPYLTQWKNTREGIYVSGIEPGNCIPEGRNAARSTGRLQWLAPGESQAFHCAITVLDGADAIHEALGRVADLNADGRPTSATLDDYAG